MASVLSELGIPQVEKRPNEPAGSVLSELGLPEVSTKAPEEPGFFSSALGKGTKAVARSSALLSDLALGDNTQAAQRISEAANEEQTSPTPSYAKRWAEGWKPVSEAWDKAETVGDYASALADTGRAVLQEPKGAAWQTLRQIPNMVPPLVGNIAGGAAGAVAGGAAGSAVPVVGTAAGGAVGLHTGRVAGASIGNAMVEAEGKTFEALQEAGVDPRNTAAVESFLAVPENRQNILAKTGKKAAALGVGDAITFGIGAKLFAAPKQAIAAADRAALTTLGVQAGNQAAVSAARASPVYHRLMEPALDKFKVANTLPKNLARGAGAAGLEVAGEGVTEYYGEMAAGNVPSLGDAVLESLMSAGTSTATAGVEAAYGMLKGGASADEILAALSAPTSPEALALPAPGAMPMPAGVAPDPDQARRAQQADENAAAIYDARAQFEQGQQPLPPTRALPRGMTAGTEVPTDPGQAQQQLEADANAAAVYGAREQFEQSQQPAGPLPPTRALPKGMTAGTEVPTDPRQAKKAEIADAKAANLYEARDKAEQEREAAMAAAFAPTPEQIKAEKARNRKKTLDSLVAGKSLTELDDDSLRKVRALAAPKLRARVNEEIERRAEVARFSGEGNPLASKRVQPAAVDQPDLLDRMAQVEGPEWAQKQQQDTGPYSVNAVRQRFAQAREMKAQYPDLTVQEIARTLGNTVIYGRGGYNRYTFNEDGQLVPLPESFSSQEALFEAQKKLGLLEPAATGESEDGVLASKRVAPKSDIGHKREISTGRYVGAPPWVGSDPKNLAKITRKLKELAEEGKRGRRWYKHAAQGILRMVGGDIDEADRLVGLIAIYSAGAEVSANTAMALRAYFQWKAGLPIKAGTGLNNEKATELMHGVGWSGVKTNNFYNNLMEHIDPSRLDPNYGDSATMDMWMALAFDYGDKKLDAGPKYRFAHAHTTHIAEKLGWTPAEAQAAIWVAMKARGEKVRSEFNRIADANGWTESVKGRGGGSTRAPKEGKRYEYFRLFAKMAFEAADPTDAELDEANLDYSDFIDARKGQLSWEAKPGPSTGVLPGIHDATDAQQFEYLAAIERALLDEQGKDIVAKELGLYPRESVGIAAWNGMLGWSSQSELVLPLSKLTGGGFRLEPGAVTLVNLLADIRGLILSQEAVGWHLPIYGLRKGDANGINIDLGRGLTQEEAAEVYDALYEALDADIPPIHTPNGFRLLNFPKGKFQLQEVMAEEGGDKKAVAELSKQVAQENEAFQAAVLDALAKTSIKPIIKDIAFFESAGELRENDWSKGDEDYRGRISEAAGRISRPGKNGWAGRPDIFEWIDNVLRPKVEAVNKDFAQRYGWDRKGDGRSRGDALDAGADRRRAVEARQSRKHFDRRVGKAFYKTPVYGTKRGGAKSRIEAVGVHFSVEPRAALDGSFYGTGLAGAERERVARAEDPRLKTRVYFYTDEGSGVTPEPGVGQQAHRVTLTNIYDPAQGRIKPTDDLNAFETAILDAGYDGYINRSFGANGAVVLLGDHNNVPVEQVGKRPEAPAAPKATPAAPKAERNVSRDAPPAEIGPYASEMGAKATAAFWAERGYEMVPEKRGDSWYLTRQNAQAARFVGQRGGLKAAHAIKLLKMRFGGRQITELTTKGILKVVETFDDLPNPIKNSPNLDGSEDGLYYQGVGYIIAANSSAGTVARTLIHEIGEHYGLEKMLGEGEYASVLDRVRALKDTDPLVADIWEQVKLLYTGEGSKIKEGDRVFVKEVLAKIGETSAGRKLAVWKRVLFAVRRFLRKLGWPVNFSSNELSDLVLASLKRQMSPRLSSVREYLGEAYARISPEGVAFKRWFGNSVVKRADGTPKVMYHGTSQDITSFIAKQAGAIFVTESPRFAEDFAYMSTAWKKSHPEHLGEAMRLMLGAAKFVKAPEKTKDRVTVQSAGRFAFFEKRPNNAFAWSHDGERWQVEKSLEPAVIGAMTPLIGRERAGQMVEALYKQPDEGANIVPVYVRAENPFDFNNDEHLEQLYATLLQLFPQQAGHFMTGVSRGDWDVIEDPDVQEAIKAAKFDGFWVKEAGTKNLAVYSPTQLKSAVGNRGAYSLEDPDITKNVWMPTYYSALARGLNQLKMESGTAQQWNLAFNTLMQKHGVKKEEIVWSGIQDWLAMQAGKVTKEDVRGYLEDNAVSVQESVYGGFSEDDRERLQDFLMERGWSQERARITVSNAIEGDDESAVFDIREEDPDFLRGLTGAGRYELYRPSASNEGYREFVLHLGKSPGKKGRAFKSNHWSEPNVVAHARADIATGKDGKRRLRIFELQSDWGQEGREEGFREKPPAPTNELAEGWSIVKGYSPKFALEGRARERSSVYQGLQSVMHEARRNGFKGLSDEETGQYIKTYDEVMTYVWKEERSEEDPTALIKEHLKLAERLVPDSEKWLSDTGIWPEEAWWVQDEEQEGASIVFRTREEALADGIQTARNIQTNRWNEAHPQRTLSGPFVTNTTSWVTLALKRLMRHAVDQGLDGVELVSGEDVADIFDLRSQVHSIHYDKYVSGPDETSYRVSVTPKDEPDSIREVGEDLSEKDLVGLVGKEVAQKMIDGEGEYNDDYDQYTLTGKDLTVGGAGMKVFYDTIVPPILNKLLKALGGGELKEVKTPGVPQTNAPITMEVVEGKTRGVSHDLYLLYDVRGRLVEETKYKEVAEKRLAEGLATPKRTQVSRVADITPEMRDKVLAGQPLFNKASLSDAIFAHTQASTKTLKRVNPHSRQVEHDTFFARAFPQVEKMIKEGQQNLIELPLPMGPTPHVLHMLGAPMQMVTIHPNIAAKLLNKHGRDFIGNGDVTAAQLLRAIREPVLVLKGDKPGRYEIITDMKGPKGDPIMVVVQANTENRHPRTADTFKSMALATAYSKKVGGLGDSITKRMAEGNTLYADKAKTTALFRDQGLIPPTEALADPKVKGDLNLLRFIGDNYDWQNPADVPAASREAPVARTMERDMIDQAEYLLDLAKSKGYETLDDFAMKDFTAFAEAASQWREENVIVPADSQTASKDKASGRTAPSVPTTRFAPSREEIGYGDQTALPSFKRWFGNSKVVDENGRPLVTYRGEHGETEEEIHSRLGSISFGSKEAANAYALTPNDSRMKAAAPRVIPSYLRIENPILNTPDDPFIEGSALEAALGRMEAIRILTKYADAVENTSNWMDEINPDNDYTDVADYLSKNPEGIKQLYFEAYQWLDDPAEVARLRKAGYDGAIHGGSGETAGETEYKVFSRSQIKSAVGNTGNYSLEDDSILASKRPAWVEQLPQATQDAIRKAGGWRPEPSLKDKLKALRKNMMLKITQGLFDQFAPIKELSEEAYMLSRLSKSGDGGLEAMMMYGKPYLNSAGAMAVDTNEKGFIPLMQELKGEHDRFLTWIAGTRAYNLKQAKKENNLTDVDISELRTLNQGNMPDGSSRAALYDRVHQQFKVLNKATLDIAEKAGLIDGASRSQWEQDFYVPFYRVLEDENYNGPRNVKGLVNQEAFKRLKGGADPLNDLMHNTLRNWSHLLTASLKNQAAVATIQTAELMGLAHEVPNAQKGAVRVMDRGQLRHYQIDDPLLFNAVTALEFAGWNNPAMKALQKAKHYLTLGVTISPVFKINNLIRDQISAIALNDMNYNVMSNLVTGTKATAKGSNDRAQLLAGGGMIRFGTFLEDDRADHTKNLIKRGVKAGNILDTAEKVKAFIGKGWDWWQEVGDRSENLTRGAVYKAAYEKAVKAGKPQDEAHLIASYAARDSMDFSLQGAWSSVRFLTQLVPFMNARLQGLYKLGREGIAPTARLLSGNAEVGDKQKAMRFGAVVGAVAMASIALLLAYEDDDDWQAREEWDRDNFWWFKIGDTAYRIPKPFEVGALGTLAERSVEMMRSGMDAESRRRFTERLGAMLGQTFALNPTPQLVKPMIDLYANTNSFTDRPIETPGMEKLSKSERSGPRTSVLAKAAGKAEVLSPVQIDFLVNAYFSWLGTHLVMATDLALRPLTGEPSKPTPRLEDIFVAGSFAKDLPANQSRYLSEFYKQAEKVQQQVADIRHMQKIGNLERAAELMRERKKEIGLNAIYTTAKAQISKINQRIRYVNMRNMDPDEKRAELDRLSQMRNRLAKMAEERRVARGS